MLDSFRFAFSETSDRTQDVTRGQNKTINTKLLFHSRTIFTTESIYSANKASVQCFVREIFNYAHTFYRYRKITVTSLKYHISLVYYTRCTYVAMCNTFGRWEIFKPTDDDGFPYIQWPIDFASIKISCSRCKRRQAKTGHCMQIRVSS